MFLYGYMMKKLPIVAIMDESDIVKDVRDGAGYHISDNSAQNLIDLIDRVKKNPKDCEQKGIRSREIYCSKYTPDMCLNKYVQLLKNLQ